MDKDTLRKKLKTKRLKLSNSFVTKASARISSALLVDFALPRDVMVYLDVKNEVKTAAIIEILLSRGHRLYVPCVCGKKLVPVEYRRGCSCSPGPFGIPEPVKKKEVKIIKKISAVLVPGVGFDKNGNRLGFGGGYFDRFLSRLKPSTLKIAPAYEVQVVKKIPSKKHDVKMDYIITEKRIYKI